MHFVWYCIYSIKCLSSAKCELGPRMVSVGGNGVVGLKEQGRLAPAHQAQLLPPLIKGLRELFQRPLRGTILPARKYLPPDPTQGPNIK